MKLSFCFFPTSYSNIFIAIKIILPAAGSSGEQAQKQEPKYVFVIASHSGKTSR